MTYIPVTEAMKRLGKSDRQVRRMAHEGKLTWRHVPHTKGKKLEILAADVDRLSRHVLPAQELERLDRLESELIQLREQLDTLSQRIEGLERSPHKTALRPLQPHTEGHTLPPDLTPLYDLIKLHNLTRHRAAIKRQMEKDGYLKTGHWKREGHEVKLALDPQGQAEFMRRYVTKDSLTHG